MKKKIRLSVDTVDTAVDTATVEIQLQINKVTAAIQHECERVTKEIQQLQARHDLETQDQPATAAREFAFPVLGDDRPILSVLRWVLAKFRRMLELNTAPSGAEDQRRDRPPLVSLMSLTDWVPSSSIRGHQFKLIADDAVDILQFRKDGRQWLARWRTAWTWIYWFNYLLTGPFSVVYRAIRKFI